MSEETIIEGEAAEIPEEEVTETHEPETTGDKAISQEPKAAATALKDALERVESLGKTLAGAMHDRANVVMVRVNDEALQHLDMLVEADITKSRSESAAFLINEGVKVNKELFGKISTITDQIAELRAQLRESVRIDVEE